MYLLLTASFLPGKGSDDGCLTIVHFLLLKHVVFAILFLTVKTKFSLCTKHIMG